MEYCIPSSLGPKVCSMESSLRLILPIHDIEMLGLGPSTEELWESFSILVLEGCDGVYGLGVGF